jgi:glycosyltransferase involved in cell wall biosynthesis
MNILFVSDVSIHDVIGGAERVLYEQTTRLAERGHGVHILTRRLPEHRSDCNQIRKVKERRYRINQNSAISFLMSTLRNGKRLFETMSKTGNFDCINFHQPFSAFAVMRSTSSNKIRKVYTCHSLAFEEYISRNAKPHPFVKRIVYSLHVASRKWIEKRVLSQSDCIIVLSKYTRDKLHAAYGTAYGNIIIIPGGIDLDRFYPAVDKGVVRKSLDLPQDRAILFTVRNLVPRMGIDNLLIAMQDIVRSVPDIYLVIGGTGPLKTDLEAMTRRMNLDCHIRFSGFIPEETLPRYYRASDLFILPTVDLEGFGMVTLEALASGIPVLGTPVGGTQEILSGFDRQFLFQDTSPDAMSKLIIDTCRRYRNQPDQWQLDSRRCRNFAERYYGWDVNVDAIERVFRKNIKDET